MSKKTKTERTRDEILDKAWDLICSEGAGVSIGRIAEAAGLTRQSIYVHFGSRDGLLMALVRRADIREDIWGAFQEGMKAPDARSRLDQCLDAWFRFVPVIYPVAQDLIRLRSHDEGAAGAWHDRMSALLEFYGQLVRSLDQEGKLRHHLSVKDATDFVWATCSVQNWSLLVMDCGWQPAKAATQLKRTIMEGICTDQ